MKSSWVKPSLRILVLLAILFLGLRFYQLADKPFGGMFWFHLVAAVVLLSVLLMETGFTLFRRKRRLVAILIAVVGLMIPVLTFSLLNDYRILLFPETRTVLSEQQWLEDLEQLAEGLRTMHPQLDAMIAPTRFQQNVDFIKQNLGNWDAQRIKVEMMKLVASVNDGHTIMPPQPAIDFNVLPFVMHKFDDGHFILSASRELADIEGAQVLQIGNKSVEEVFQIIQEHIGAENRGQKLDRFPLYGAMAELLYESGITASSSSAAVTFEKDGDRFTRIIDAKPYYQWAWFYFHPKDAPGSLPYQHNLYRRHYWSELLTDEGILYVNINNLQDQDGLSIGSFASDLEQELDEMEYDKLVIDLRQNRGGDNFKSRQLASVVRDSLKANHPGRLFVLVSRRTFSAGVNLASLLENQTHAMFVGEDTGQGPNHYGDARGLQLNNSHIWVAVSSVDWRGGFAGDIRTAIEPHFRIGYRFEDYINGQDPLMDFVEKIDIGSVTLPGPATELKQATYLTDEGQLVKIRENAEGSWYLSINDYSNVSLHQVVTPLCRTETGGYQTTLRHLQLSFDSKNQLQLSVSQNPIPMDRVSDDYRTPFELISRGEADRGINLLSKTDAYDYLPLEQHLKSIGYEYFDNRQPGPAISIFSYIRDRHPRNTYSWSRLAYAQLRAGEIGDAIQNFEQALVLNPDNQTAQDMMIRLQQEIAQ